MTAKGIEDLIFPPPRDFFSGDNGAGELFIKALQINDILSHFFRFNIHESREQAVDVIRELSQDNGKTRKRQTCLRYLLETENFPRLAENSSRASMSYRAFDKIEFYREGRLVQGALKSCFSAYTSLMSTLEEFSDNAKGSYFEEIKGIIGSIKSSDWFKNAKQQLSTDQTTSQEVLENILKKLNHSFCNTLKKLAITLDYFVGFASGFKELQQLGADIIFPELIPSKGYRICDIKGAVNPLLYLGENLKKEKMPVDIYSDEISPIRVLMAENMYGKTIALKTRGLFQALTQAGLPILAKSARLTNVDKILANIGVGEDALRGKSTYKNINETTFRILKQATQRSLLLLDEPTSGTYGLKAVAQAEIYLDAIARRGYETWVVTHHLQLADMAKEHPQIVNMTIEVIDGKPTYRLIPGIFSPTEQTVRVDYNREEVMGAAARGNYRARLEQLKKEGRIPQEHSETLSKILESLGKK